MSDEEIDFALKQLIDDGLVYMAWSEEENDFIYGLTSKGEVSLENEDS